jgi:polysaccharide deacetylase family protein (PEP-CTERM system associated)
MASHATPKHCVLTIDVEDWFHILEHPAAPHPSEWEQLPSRIERNLCRLLDLLDEYGVKCTLFMLGWLAERHPQLVRRAHAGGHEVASHGYAHRLAGQMTAEEFRADAVRSRELLEAIIGGPVAGYRAAGFSVTEETPWFFDALVEAGYRYDSSVFPGRHGHGGLRSAGLAPWVVHTEAGLIHEFPVSLVKICGRRLCLFGGGYFRLAPYVLIRRGARGVKAEGRPVIFYLHPREIDPEQPRLPLGLRRSFKTYVNLHTTEPKLRRLISDFHFVRLAELMEPCPDVYVTKE